MNFPWIGEKLLALLVACAPAVLLAQPVLDQADAPQPGDVFPYINVNYVPIADGGPDAVWDLSGIGSAGPVNLPCVDPAATSYADQFPTAGIAFDAGSLISYMRADATGLYAVGAWKNVGTESILIHFTDESLFLPYPCTYGTSFSDPFAYTYDYSGGTVDGSGSANYEADGFGTLVMPYDTIHNVLRVAGVDTSMEGIPGLSYLTVSQQVYFFKPGIHYYLLSATQVSQSVNGGPAQQVSSLFFLAPSALSGVHELAM